MKRSDFYFCTSLIMFILCIGMSNIEITSIDNYFLAISINSNLLLNISVIALILTLSSLITIIYHKVNSILKSSKKKQ